MDMNTIKHQLLSDDDLVSGDCKLLVDRIDELRSTAEDPAQLDSLRDHALKRLNAAILQEAPAKLEAALKQLPAALDRLEAMTAKRDEAEQAVCDMLQEIRHARALLTKHGEETGTVQAADMERAERLLTSVSPTWLKRMKVC